MPLQKLSQLIAPYPSDEHEYEFSYQRIDPIFNNLLNESDLYKYQLIIDDFESPIIYCNLYLLKDALMNIIQNSKEAMEKGGVIKITFDNVNCINENFVNKVYNDYFCINISDEGIGIPEEYLDKIFDPFFTTKEAGKGTGLGLSVVYGIVKSFDGFINVYSEPGEGTVVNIFFPKYVERFPDVILAKDINDKDREVVIPKNKILVVEDDPTILDMIKKMLSLLDQDVVAFNNPLELLNMAENYKNQINILIADVIMPQMNGIELYNKLKTSIPHLKVIFISGYSDSGYKELMNDIKSSVFLQKPFTMDDLKEALKKIS